MEALLTKASQCTIPSAGTSLPEKACALLCGMENVLVHFFILWKYGSPELFHRFWILYRAKQDGPVVLGWRHPWESHGDHGHGH